MIKEYIENWSGEVNTLVIGATPEEGGSRRFSVKIGGERTLPFLFKEALLPFKPVIAYEIWDIEPIDWATALSKYYGDVWGNTLEWADKLIREYKAELLCLKLAGAHPEIGKDLDEIVKLLEGLLKKVDIPLIIIGCGDVQRDNFILPLCSQILKNERCLIGEVNQDNYKTLTAAVLADGHSIIAQSPIDINIAKQLNILISDMGLPLERIVINPTVGALGYGLEYTYSIMERLRLAALNNDRVVASPFICFVGQESWRVKEATTPEKEFSRWGSEWRRGYLWELITAGALLQAGANILVMRHPKAIEKIKEYIDKLYEFKIN
ncbi:MAG: acetyl-CoA decarbonylase/synthase complex subunit delta [Candidatus Omnitrophica bacterium]|nr:acetyl-CoA decarbonylase/synthase complex subunit delta [Candidatus Omnitrophota bacterium]